MSIDRSLRSHLGLVRSRNVLTRAERIKILTEEDRWDADRDSVFGLPKVAVKKTKAGTKSKQAEEKPQESAETTEGKEKSAEENSGA